MAFEKWYLEFDGSKRGSIDNAAPRFRGNWSIETRYRIPSGGSGGGTLFDAYDEIAGAGRGIKITIDNVGRPTITLATGYSQVIRVMTGSFSPDTWYHLVLSFESISRFRCFIDAVERDAFPPAPYGGFAITGNYHIGANYNEDISDYENQFVGDILLFGYYVGNALTQDEVTKRYNYWNFHRGLKKLSWGSNIDDGGGSVATDILGGPPILFASPPNNPIWHLYGAYADPVFELWRDWDDIISMCLLPFGTIEIAAQVIVAACAEAEIEAALDPALLKTESEYDALTSDIPGLLASLEADIKYDATGFNIPGLLDSAYLDAESKYNAAALCVAGLVAYPVVESKYDATTLCVAAIDAAEHTPVYADSKYDATGAYFSAMDYDEIYIGHKFLKD